AKKAGLNDEQATAYAEANKEANATAAQNALETIIAENERMALDEALYQAKGEYHNNPAYALGEVTATRGGTSSSCINNYCSKFNSHSLVYNQPYSVVIGEYTSKQDGYRFSESSNISVQGLKTEELAIPTLGKATYSGKAFTRDGNYLQTGGLGYQGTLSYDVNFENRTGAGSITGLGDTVELQQGTISGTGISAIAQQGYKNGNYLLDFYGKKAEEIAGKVIFDGKDTIGFGGTRGEISKK
ncbi:Slam-dependent surface lipoprotein, partial [Psychrobacter faecalis]